MIRVNINEWFDESEKPLDRLVPDGGYTTIFRTIACVGDSLSSGEFESVNDEGTPGYHDMFEYSWGQFIARMCGSTVQNFSRGGMKASEYCDGWADSMGYWDPKKACQCYIIALGVNDLLGAAQEVGTVDDIDPHDWRNNKKTFAGYYAQIIARYKEIQPRAKFFLLTMTDEPECDERCHIAKEEHRKLLYEMAKYFDNTYVLDLLAYAPVYDEQFKKRFFMRGHMNPMGYKFTADIVVSYIDYIIRHHMNDFDEVPFIGTQLHK